MSAPESGYAPVNGLQMYYEIHGEGEPLVLLHGGPTTIDTSFGLMIPTLAQHRRLIAIEQQGHGHTADIERPMTFAQMADDTAALLRHLGVERADFFGYSDGGNVALGVAIRHPEMVRKFAIAGTHFENEGMTPGMVDILKSIGPDDLGPLKDAYEQVAPRPGDWPTLVKKVMQMGVEFPGWRRDDLRMVRAPALVAIGDADVIRPEHAAELARLLPHAHLAVLPATDHVALVLARAEWLLMILLDFFDAPMPEGA